MDSILDYLAAQSDKVVSQTHKNAMELLVAEEIKKQLKSSPPEIAGIINQVEVATYALNRLPSLYATSEEGLIWQKQRGLKEFQEQIVNTVRQAIEIVDRDPARFTTPLLSPEHLEIQEARASLQELIDWLWLYQSELTKSNISWGEVTGLLKQTIAQVLEEGMNFPKTSDRK